MFDNIEQLTLESLLLDAEEDQFNFESSDSEFAFEEVCFEMMDIERELMTIENNLMVLEAAAAIKLAKSKKKAVKSKKTTMKAKDAKALKKSGAKAKVKKVTKEDEEVDGGTGPQPTTTDTNGLTDDDVDALPDEVDVQVVEPTTEAASAADLLGIEGEDYFIVHEDGEGEGNAAPAENGGNAKADENKKNLLQKIGEAFQKFFQMLGELIARIVGAFTNVEKALGNAGANWNDAAIVKGKVPNFNKVNSLFGKLTKLQDDGGKELLEVTKPVTEAGFDNDKNRFTASNEGFLNDIKALKSELSTILSETQAPENGQKVSDVGGKTEIQAFVKNFSPKGEVVKKIKEQQAATKKVIADLKKIKNSYEAQKARKTLQGLQALASCYTVIYGRCCGAAMKVIKAASSGGENK